MNVSPSAHSLAPTHGLAHTQSDRAIDKAKLAHDQAQIRELSARDREVRAHEQAHASVGGPHAGHPSYSYTRGPNGVRYAQGGQVSIDISPVAGDPQATLEKMQTVARAALAPAQPSAQDRAVAAKANQQAAQARAELARTESDKLSLSPKDHELGAEIGTRGGYVSVRL